MNGLHHSVKCDVPPLSVIGTSKAWEDDLAGAIHRCIGVLGQSHWIVGACSWIPVGCNCMTRGQYKMRNRHIWGIVPEPEVGGELHRYLDRA